jgi:hypothetical protein
MRLSTKARTGLAVGPILALAAVVLLRGDLLAARMEGRPAPAAQQATEGFGGRQITITASGDILVHPPTWQQGRADAERAGKPGYDFTPLFADVRDTIAAADLAICHMEAPMHPGAPRDFPRFRAPTDMAAAVAAAGYDTCSTASNHSLDQGEAGVSANLDALEAAGLSHTGTYRTAQAATVPTVYDVAGVKVGHLSYAYGLNPGTATPPGKAWLANLIDPAAILAAARAARAAGAEIVVLSIHWGTEGVHEPNAQQVELARTLTASPDIDLIIGHHAHVVQPIERVNGKWVAYGVGNTIARHDFPTNDNREGVIVSFTFTRAVDGRWEATRAEATPIWLSLKPTLRLVDLADVLSRLSTLDRRRGIYQPAYDRITGHVTARGAADAGLVVTPIGGAA